MWAGRRTQLSPIGLHLGPTTATLVQLSGRTRDARLLAYADRPLVTSDTLPPAEEERALAVQIRQLVQDHRFRGRAVVSCLGSHELHVQNARFPPLPADELEKIVRFEAEGRLPYPVAEAEVRHLVAGEVRVENALKQEVILMACRQEAVARKIRVIEQAGLYPVAIDTEPTALLRGHLATIPLPDEGGGVPRHRTGFLHLGERVSTVMFAEDDRILFLKYLQLGSGPFNEAVARELKLSVQDAQKLRDVVNSSDHLDASNEIHRSVIDAIRDLLELLTNELEMCLRYHKVTFRGKGLERMLISGRDASVWLGEYLEDRFDIPCQTSAGAQDFAQKNPDRARLGSHFAVALGLALKPVADIS